MDERLLALAREHARKHGATFNQLVRDLVSREVNSDRGAATRAMFELTDRLGLRSENGPMTREEAHERDLNHGQTIGKVRIVNPFR